MAKMTKAELMEENERLKNVLHRIVELGGNKHLEEVYKITEAPFAYITGQMFATAAIGLNLDDCNPNNY